MREERTPQLCYVHRGITYLPHYSMQGYFVKPGMKLNGLSMSELADVLYTEEDFKGTGAATVMLNLWPRGSVYLNFGY